MDFEKKTTLIDIVIKRGLSYDGKSEPFEFIQTLEELANFYEFALNVLLKAMPLILIERALTWYRNNNVNWKEWIDFKSDFLQFFLPSNYYENLEEKIQERFQLPDEAFKDYVLGIQSLMRHANLSGEQKLQQIYRNSQPHYKEFIYLKGYSCLSDMIKVAEKYEKTVKASSRSDCQVDLTEIDIGPPSSKRRKLSDNQTSLQCETGSLTATFLIADKLVTAIIDTSSTKNFIRRDFVKSVKEEPYNIEEQIEVKLTEESITAVSTYIEFQITLGCIAQKCRFFIVTESTNEVVVGLEFLRDFKCSLEIAGLEVNCDNIATKLENLPKMLLQPEFNASFSTSLPPSQSLAPSPQLPTSTSISCTKHQSPDLTGAIEIPSNDELASLPAEVFLRIESALKLNKRQRLLFYHDEICYRIIIDNKGKVRVQIKK